MYGGCYDIIYSFQYKNFKYAIFYRSMVKAEKEEADATRTPIIIFRKETIEVAFIFCVFEYFVKWMEWSIIMECRLHFTTTNSIELSKQKKYLFNAFFTTHVHTHTYIPYYQLVALFAWEGK